MAGALMQLVAYGAQDVYLTGNPQITFFKAVYRRHTNFAMESMRQTLNGSTGFGNRVTCKVARNGDLIGRTYVRQIVTGGAGDSVLVNRAGFSILNQVELRVGGQLIDRHSGLWMHCWTELTHSTAQKAMLDDIVGETQLNAAGNVTLNNAVSRTLNIPLQFAFCRNPGLALPLISLQYHEVEIIIDFAPTSASLGTNNPTLGETEVWIDYIFLDTEERKNFAQNPHEYLIETVQSQTQSVPDDSTDSIRLNFNHPVKELVWVGRPSTPVDDRFTGFINGTFNQNTDTQGSVLTNTTLRLNGQDRFSQRDYRYFQYIQPHQHHSGTPQLGINSYSFALKPEEHQPSGTCNFSRIDNATLELSTQDSGSAVNVTVFAHGYNVFRVASGMGGLAYSN